jgi:hypothetical protein
MHGTVDHGWEVTMLDRRQRQREAQLVEELAHLRSQIEHLNALEDTRSVGKRNRRMRAIIAVCVVFAALTAVASVVINAERPLLAVIVNAGGVALGCLATLLALLKR